MTRTQRKSNGSNSTLHYWVQIGINVLVLLIGFAIAYGGLDKRLSITELKIETALKSFDNYATKDRVDQLEKDVEYLKQREERK